MTSRSRFIITTLFACHLFLRPALLTSQLPPAGQTSAPAVPTGPSSPQAAPPSNGASPTPTPSPSSDVSQPASPSINDEAQEDREIGDFVEQEIQQAQGPDEQFGPPRPGANVVPGRDEVIIRGDEQEKNQDIYKARGHVEVRFRTYILHADEITYDSTTGHIVATGHVVFDGGPHSEHIVGSRATYDVSRDTGTFYDATGSTGVRVKNKMMFLTSSTPFFFKGKVIEKLGPDRYRVNHGYVTSCQSAKPNWQFNAQTATVELGDDARMHHATLRIRGIPLFYFPYVEHPVDNLGRKSGFLIPLIGQSNSRGWILGDSFYWAINRNSDATFGAEYFSLRGWAQHGEYRAIGYHYTFQGEYYGVVDNDGVPAGQPGAGTKQGGEEIRVVGTAALPWKFQGTLSLDYLSSYIFRLAFAQSFIQAVNSEVRSGGFITRNWDGYAFGTLISRYQNYQSATAGDFIEIDHLPSFEFSSVERSLWNSRFMYAYDAEASGLSRSEPGFSTPYVGRVDAYPTLSMPNYLRGWTLRPDIGIRETFYTAHLLQIPGTTIGTVANTPIDRNVLQASMEIRPPSVSKMFEHKPFGYVYKHTIEPRVIYRYQTGISNYGEVLRFDYRDILANDNEVEYGVINRLFAKKTTSNSECFEHPKYIPVGDFADAAKSQALIDAHQVCDDRQGPAREIVTWELAQKYYMNNTWGGALVPGTRNVFDSTIDLTGIAFLTEPRRFSPLISRFRVSDGNTDFQWSLDYDPVLHQVNDSTIFGGHRWSNWYFAGGQTYLNAPGEVPPGTTTQDVWNQYRMLVQYGNLIKKGLSSSFQIAVDSRNHYVQGVSSQTSYNWDCCGVTFEYRRVTIPSVRNENFYKFALSLTNFGTFGNLRRIDRLY